MLGMHSGREYTAFSPSSCASLTTAAARVVCFLIDGRTGVQFLQALRGSRWNVTDGIDNGIPLEVVFGFPMLAMFERKRK
jgi:hypothetical protein